MKKKVQRLIKSSREIELLRVAGRHLAEVLTRVAGEVKEGITTRELDLLSREWIESVGDRPSFLNYKPAGVAIPFPATLCVSVNDEVVHGIPSDRVLYDGDIVSLDLGLWHQGVCVDAAVTVIVNAGDAQAMKLIEVTRQALKEGVAAARGGGHVGDIGAAIEAYVKPYRYGIVQELGGHGVGLAVHEQPYIPNYGTRGTGPLLEAGMVLAIEPMLNEGSEEVKLALDKFTFSTVDGGRSAHFEHTVVITEGEPEVITIF